MALSVTVAYAGKYTLQGRITTGAAPDSGNIYIPAEVENYWLRRLGFIIGTPGTKNSADLVSQGVIDLATHTKVGDVSWSIVINNTITYDPTQPAGSRLYVEISTVGSGSAGGDVRFYISLTHSIKR